MKTHHLRLALAMVTAGCVLALANVAQASLFEASSGEPLPAPPATGKCCPKPCIEYHEHRPCKKICCTCDPPHTVVFQVKDPCTCCVYDVPVCVPACCTEAPCVEEHCGLFGRSVYEYNWCCGYKAKIIVGRCGNIDVHTWGK